MGACLCRRWRWWTYTSSTDKDDKKDPWCDTPAEPEPSQDRKSRLGFERQKKHLGTVLNSIKAQSLRFQSSATAYLGINKLHMKDVQPAYEDNLAYEKIQSGQVALPTQVPGSPTNRSDSLGLIYFSISYNEFTRVLKILIDRAEGLPKMDRFGTSDPYVKVSLIPDLKVKMETEVKRNTLAPRWNEILSFLDFPHEKLMKKSLVLQVFDHDKVSRDDEIGEVVLPLRDILVQNQPVEFVKELTPSTHSSRWLGDILLSLCYSPSDRHFTVIVMKGRNMKPTDLNGKSDPYVKVTLINCGLTMAKKKTSVKMKCLDPVWNEVMVFEIGSCPIRDIQILVTVMDYNHHLPNKTVGYIIIGSKSTGSRLRHWTDTLILSKTAVAMWHRIVN